MSVTKHVCAFVALGIQHAMRTHHIVICGLARSSNIFQHYLINGMILVGGGEVTEHKICFDFFYNFCLKHFSL
jgi:hypothetical protein